MKTHRSVIGSFDGEKYFGGKNCRRPSLFVVLVSRVLTVYKMVKKHVSWHTICIRTTQINYFKYSRGKKYREPSLFLVLVPTVLTVYKMCKQHSSKYIPYTNYQMRCYSKNPFAKTVSMYIPMSATCSSFAVS